MPPSVSVYSPNFTHLKEHTCPHKVSDFAA
jgi:hypothetical protein